MHVEVIHFWFNGDTRKPHFPIFEIFDDEVYRMRYFYFPSDVITKLRSYELVAELPWLKYLDSNYLFWSRLTFYHPLPKPCTNF